MRYGFEVLSCQVCEGSSVRSVEVLFGWFECWCVGTVCCWFAVVRSLL